MNTSRDSGLLRGIATFLRVLGWIGLILGIAGAVVLLFLDVPNLLRWIGVFLCAALGVGWFVPMYGFGSVLHLLLDMERYTRPPAA